MATTNVTTTSLAVTPRGRGIEYSLRDSNPRPKTSALNWRLRPLGQNCEVIGGALVVKPDPNKLDRSLTTNPEIAFWDWLWLLFSD